MKKDSQQASFFSSTNDLAYRNVLWLVQRDELQVGWCSLYSPECKSTSSELKVIPGWVHSFSFLVAPPLSPVAVGVEISLSLAG